MQIEYTKQALKSIKKIPPAQRKKIGECINDLPSGDIKKLQGYAHSYRLRTGGYRVLYTLKGDVIQIDDILPRGDAYKR